MTHHFRRLSCALNHDQGMKNSFHISGGFGERPSLGLAVKWQVRPLADPSDVGARLRPDLSGQVMGPEQAVSAPDSQTEHE